MNAFHAANPLVAGIAKGELAEKLGLGYRIGLGYAQQNQNSWADLSGNPCSQALHELIGPGAPGPVRDHQHTTRAEAVEAHKPELDELIERLSYEKDRLEKDEAIYGLTDCDAEMKFYGREVTRVIGVLREEGEHAARQQDDQRPGDREIAHPHRAELHRAEQQAGGADQGREPAQQ